MARAVSKYLEMGRVHDCVFWRSKEAALREAPRAESFGVELAADGEESLYTATEHPIGVAIADSTIAC
jgi:hypothetical protein